MYDLVVKGRVVAPAGIVEGGWIAVSDGLIAAIGTGAAPTASTSRDYGSAYLLPGVIDGQTHAGSQIGFAGMGPTSRAAAMGGVTTIVDMPYDDPDPVTTGALLSEKIDAVERLAVCDVALYGTVPTSPNREHIAELIAGGVCAFKISSFEAHPHRFPRIGNAATHWLLETLGGTGLPVGLHNEDQEIVRSLAATFRAEGRTSPSDHSPSRPEVAELTATANFLELGAATGSHLHIVHISIAEGFDLVRAYRDRGVNASAEMCVHYLLFDAAHDTPRLGGLLKVNPPIRSGQKDALWQVLEAGGCTFVSSDHSAWPLDRKQNASIFDVAAGMPGLETLLPAFFTGASARSGGDAAARMTADLLSDKVATFFGLPRKGKLAPGFDADIAVLDPTPGVYDSKRNADGPGWSAYDGVEFAATPAATFVRGRQVWDGAAITAPAGHGRFVARPER
ncbi:amidohydrolase family protein [Mesorhizobium sp. BR1-1-16]|uniref:dihydroorotase n=1 Tax=Mesorhizobium sp. BR1-1-16 TaxID=2876653 RepID=UPI001CCFFB64|nr:amidohydrolase family protein [Mesorhizobium sp. BR1-1-16]MBZ9935587.1 amidohydrolase family protein [Mesorhizobium sp. BR1-1-16]